MKIAVWHNLPSGGGKRALYYHVKGLIERGHTVESWCPSTADQTYLPLSELITEHIIPLTWKPKSPKTALDRLILSYQNKVDMLKALKESCQQCAKEINVKDFDVLLANSCYYCGTAPIGRYVKIPKVIYLQEPFRPLYESQPHLPWMALPPPTTHWWSSKYLKPFLRDLVKVQGLRIQVREEWLNAKSYDKILVNSFFSRESILRSYGLDAQVCYLGINTDMFQAQELTRENFVVGLGGIYYSKGIDRAIAALGTIPKSSRPDFIWIGNVSEKSYKQEMENLALSLGVNLHFKVRVTDQELVSYLNRATALIYTSRLEPFGFAPLEANACGTPVVAIAEGGIRETIREGVNGFLINDNDPVVLGKAVLNLIENPDLVKAMAQPARQNVLDSWTWEKAVDRLETCLLNNYHCQEKCNGKNL